MRVGLAEDEAYYWLLSQAPSFSYLDHPPMVGWMIRAGTLLAGDNALGIRLATVLCGLIGPFVLWRTADILFDREIATAAVWIALAMPLLAVGGVIITPDTPSALFWGLTGWAVAELYRSKDPNWWLAVGVWAGCGLLSKYTNLFVGAGILLWLLAAPNRHWFRSWQLWVGGALSCVLFLPVVIWNANNEWASFAKQFGRATKGQGVSHFYLAELAGAFVVLASPLIAGLAVIGLLETTRRALHNRASPSFLLAAFILPLTLYFFVHALHSRVQANWLAPLYPALAICAAVALTRALTPEAGWRRPWARSAIPLGLTVSGLIYAHAIHPLISLAGMRDPVNQTRGWKQFSEEVERLRIEHGACWIATSSYGTTAQLAYQLRTTPVAQLNERERYRHLPGIAAADLECPALYVELAHRQNPGLLTEHFDSAIPVGRVTRASNGTSIADYVAVVLEKPRSRLVAQLHVSGDSHFVSKR